jgi:hypothetical protein
VHGRGELQGTGYRHRYLSRVGRFWEIRTDVEKYSFVNRTITDWNQLSGEVLGTSPGKPRIFRKRVRKVITIEVK